MTKSQLAPQSQEFLIRTCDRLHLRNGARISSRESLSSDTPPAITPANSIPRLIGRIEFREYGSKYLRFGDLNGDGLPEILLVQVNGAGGEDKSVITCLTVLDLEGNLLWQVGEPNRSNTYFVSDFPVQIFDIDRDGRNEVIYMPDEKNVLMILEGSTGKLRKQVQLAGGKDSLLFADFAGRGYPQNLLVKDRYTSFWVYDMAQNFKLLWSKLNVNPGHYPMNYDLDGDGKDELLCGYTLYAPDGRELWSHPELGDVNLHDDAVYIEDMDGDGRAEIAIACSSDAVLLDSAGALLFRKKMNHCQHALIGRFRPDLSGKQVFYLSREKKEEGAELPFSQSTRYGYSLEGMFTRSGQLLWSKNHENIWSTGAQRVDNWTGRAGENLVALYSRGFAPPALIDGYGREVASFPFPPAILKKGKGPNGTDVYDEYYIQHLDCYGDEREEMLIWNEKALYIYTNAAVWQKPNLYNHTYYPGRM